MLGWALAVIALRMDGLSAYEVDVTVTVRHRCSIMVSQCLPGLHHVTDSKRAECAAPVGQVPSEQLICFH